MWGDKTLSKTHLNRLHDSRIIGYIKRFAHELLLEFRRECNDKVTRSDIKIRSSTFLQELINKKAIYSYIVICDNRNNTSKLIDTNKICLIFHIKLTETSEVIKMKFTLGPTIVD